MEPPRLITMLVWPSALRSSNPFSTACVSVGSTGKVDGGRSRHLTLAGALAPTWNQIHSIDPATPPLFDERTLRVVRRKDGKPPPIAQPWRPEGAPGDGSRETGGWRLTGRAEGPKVWKLGTSARHTFSSAFVMDLPSEDLTAVQHASTAASLISGSVGGMMQVLVGQPLDTIKTRAQIAPPGTITGPMDVARRTLAQEGFLGFYKGTSRNAFAVVWSGGSQFASLWGIRNVEADRQSVPRSYCSSNSSCRFNGRGR
ncbi:hypothetical protein PCANC_06381 [Puccinia coronata f. sp. avenae]|uniref:Uncharacterized protein n=1 Tax=Puccinia coronata f. sp. avenae TaxID=200324 RepID=A0A2N5VVS1_9BASI|nr:hypothetical protein PCANC_06381 [Puccinia coronata f. sp. avenae]